MLKVNISIENFPHDSDIGQNEGILRPRQKISNLYNPIEEILNVCIIKEKLVLEGKSESNKKWCPKNSQAVNLNIGSPMTWAGHWVDIQMEALKPYI